MVHKILSIDDVVAMRNLMLQNTETNTVEKFFDDSGLVNEGGTFITLVVVTMAIHLIITFLLQNMELLGFTRMGRL
ncbi:hypothetical protein [Lactiplantibacillus pentosus]|uniref:hypothetical protein n=1 Tax=Lactiplantibacillus pentosus TaxID=1589 RepID=UPI0013309539|nr:hypothetical protein [Lactiplantibacillus pentosus]MBU7463566.1 hypothetical protein [Lactiplantibacillus pentosus]MBU7491261.1 hypothetical protein [Lactiplantibacillus pentosus]MBU7493631.1 hypothetical protein [Lactiplantibacillus pentosus]MBU7519633.1 hypothetical protein [Lactiplantibacillus pentosus]MBU7524756.1 hypothetical protein [Lactiplantibacillus pentosus]